MRPLTTALLLLLLVAGPAAADEVLFLNGDRLTGKIVSAAGGKLVLKTEAAGDITIDLAKVKTFAADAPVALKLGEQPPVESRVTAGVEGEVQRQIPPGTPPQPSRSRTSPPSIPRRPRGTVRRPSMGCSRRGTPRPSRSASRRVRPSAGRTTGCRSAESTATGARRIRTPG